MLVNRKAGSGRGREVVDQVVARLKPVGVHARLVTDFDMLRELSAELHASRSLRAVIAAGGDGTVGAALNAIPEGVPLAVLPMGTENLLGRYVRHTRIPERMVSLLTTGYVAPFDAAQAGDRLFAMMLSAGFDAEVVRRVHGCRKGNITHLAYAGPICSAIRQYSHPPMRVQWTDAQEQKHAVECRWTFALNMPRYAMQLPIAPGACGYDGLLDLCLFRHGSFLSGLRYLSYVMRGCHDGLADVSTARTARVRLEGVNGDTPIPYQIDGDPGGFLPVEVSIAPARMPVVITAEVARDLGFALPPLAAARD